MYANLWNPQQHTARSAGKKDERTMEPLTRAAQLVPFWRAIGGRSVTSMCVGIQASKYGGTRGGGVSLMRGEFSETV